MNEAAEPRELMARALHDRYRQNQRGVKPPDDPAMQPWETLPEPLRASNRAMAGGLEDALRTVGCGVRAANPDEPAAVFAADEVETMAAVVHGQWVAERLANGWTPGPRDVVNKTTPYLVPYEELADDVQEWDRQVVRSIPEVLAAAGLEVCRPQQAGPR